MMKFSDIFEFQSKSGIKAGDGLEAGKYFFYTSSNEQTKFLNDHLFEGDALVFGTGGNPSVHFNDSKFAVSTDCLVAQPKDKRKVYAKFYYYFLRGNMRILEKGFKGAGLKHISKGYISAIELPKVDFDQQKKIVEILYHADVLRQRRKQSLQLLDDFLRATFLDMFWDLENRKKWKIVRLNEFIRHLTSGGRGWSKYYAEVGARFIRSFDVQMNSISNDEKMYIKPPKNQEADRTRIEPLDILLTITGSKIGRVATMPEGFEEAYVSQHVAIIRVDKINRLYLSYYLSMLECGQRIIQRQQYGQTKPGLSLDQIKKFPIPNPPIKLQNKFAQIVGNLEQTKQKMQTSLAEMDNQFNALTQRYFG